MNTNKREHISLRSTPSIIPISLPGNNADFEAKLARCRTEYFESACQSVWSGLGLLALRQPGQAFLLLMQSAEVALKGVIQDILNRGIAEVGRRNTNVLRGAASKNADVSEAMLKPLLGENGGFRKSFEFVNQNLGFLENFTSCYGDLYSSRNRVAHSGALEKFDARYVEDILTKILPLIEELFEDYLDAKLTDRIDSKVIREALVARKFMSGEERSFSDWRVGLTTFQRAYFAATNVNDIAHCEFNPWDNDEDHTRRRFDESLMSQMGDCLLNDDSETPECRICSGECFVSVNLPRGEYAFEEMTSASVAALACPACRLYISDDYSDLAEAHFGTICEETVGKESWEAFVKSLD